jgi:hypothetical protein
MPNPRDEVTNWTTAKGATAREKIEGWGDTIYNDMTNEFLEYEFVVGPMEMNQIKQDNRGMVYTEMVGFDCRDDGKECLSDFISKFSNWQRNPFAMQGRDRFRYFIWNEDTGRGEWEFGSLRTGTINSLDAYPRPSADMRWWP